VSISSETLYHRQRLYQEALGVPTPDLAMEFWAGPIVASGGVCAPPSPIYHMHTFTIARIADAFDFPPELILPIPEELDQ